MKSIYMKIPWVLLALLLVAAGCAGPGGQVRTSVEEAAVARVLSVTAEDLPDRVRLNIEGTAPFAYTVFRLSEPLRLIVDLADTDVTSLGDEIAISMGNVSSVNAIQFDEEAGRIGRLEIALIELWDYETSRMDNSIVVDFVKPASAAAGRDAEEAEPSRDVEPRMEVVELDLPGEMTDAQRAELVEEALEPARAIDRVLFYEEDGHFSIEFVGDGAVGRYDAINLAGPTRLVIDIWDVTKGFKPRVIPVEMSGVSRIRVGEHRQEGKLRFVLDLEAGEVPPYTIDRRGEKLVVILGLEAAPEIEIALAPETQPAPVIQPIEEPPAEPAPEVLVKETPAPVVSPAGPVVREIRYRVDEKGGAVLIVSDSPVEFSLAQPDSRHLIVDLKGVDLSRALVRSQDTRDIGGPLQALSSYNPKGAGGARVSLTYSSGTLYESEQIGGTLTILLASPETAPPQVAVETAPEPAAAEAPAPVPRPVPRVVPKPVPARPRLSSEAKVVAVEEGPKFTGEVITLDFQEADILNVIRLIAEVSGLNIITGDKVKGKISMRMVNVPWDQALDVILKTKGLDQIRDGNVVRILPASQLEKERKAAVKARETELEVEELILKIVPVSYSKAAEIRGQLSPFLSSRGSINVDRRTNSLIVKDVEENIRQIEDLVAELDIPTPQVRIEARIVIVDESYTKNLGIQWGGEYDNGDIRIFGDSGGVTNGLVNLPAANPTTAIGFEFGSVGNFTNLDLRLSALEQLDKGRIISSPSFLVIQNEKAVIEVNNPFPENRTSTEVSDEGTTTTTSVSFSNIVTKLEITPQVTANRDIFMEVFVEKDSKGQQQIFDANVFTGVNTHKLQTKIIVKDEGTAVIGGVFTESEKEGSSSVPFFNKIPLLGWLFKNKSTEKTREELLIFINASIVDG